MLKVHATGEDKVKRLFSLLKRQKNKMITRLNRAFGETVVSIMKDKYLSASSGDATRLHNRTGGLIGSAYVQLKGKGVIYGTTKFYGPVHEFGPTTITAKNKPFLTFQINGKWIRKKEVTIPKREYARPAREDFFKKKLHQKVADRVLRQWIKELT